MYYDIEEVSKDTITVAVRGTIFDRGKLWDKFGPIREKIPLTYKTFTFHFTGKTMDGKEIPFLPLDLQSSAETKVIIILYSLLGKFLSRRREAQTEVRRLQSSISLSPPSQFKNLFRDFRVVSVVVFPR